MLIVKSVEFHSVRKLKGSATSSTSFPSDAVEVAMTSNSAYDLEDGGQRLESGRGEGERGEGGGMGRSMQQPEQLYAEVKRK